MTMLIIKHLHGTAIPMAVVLPSANDQQLFVEKHSHQKGLEIWNIKKVANLIEYFT